MVGLEVFGPELLQEPQGPGRLLGAQAGDEVVEAHDLGRWVEG